MYKQEKAGGGGTGRRSKAYGELSKATCEAKESGGGKDSGQATTQGGDLGLQRIPSNTPGIFFLPRDAPMKKLPGCRQIA